MVVLRAIGGFFVRIGRWIKETAWVQPLLIVGGIFAIIFSIPYITNWVGSWFSGSNASNKFYEKHKVSLSGADKGESDADALFSYMASPRDQKKAEDVQKWGEKFFVVFVQEDCAGCEDIYKGFEVLEDEWGSNAAFSKEGSTEKFKLHTIFIDTEDTINDEKKNLFQSYFFDRVDSYFEEVMAVMQESNYVKNLAVSSSYLSELETLNSVESFASPTVFLYDPACEENVTTLGVSEVLFTVNGKDNQSGSYPIAYTLFDCWYHQDIFASNYQAK
ncbi:MAG: hypothetical protein K5906_02025 [Bacilli bacterium]|nr:hypothetical protein [Bacilli bacterium]